MAIAAALTDAQATTVATHYREAPKPDASHRLRVVVFMTDGDVAGAEQVLRTSKERLVDTRVHVLGIGDAVNHAMLAAIAREGGGTYTPVATDEDLERALVRLKNATYAPVWTGIRARIEGAGDARSLQDVEPQGAMDLFAGEPFAFAWRGAIARGDKLVLEGERAGGKTFKVIAPLEENDDDRVAPTLWALLKNRRLTYRFDDADDAALESLGATFGVTNRAVALVAVDSEQRDVTIEARVPVVLPMPRNAAAAGPPPGAMNFAAMPMSPSPAPMGQAMYAPITASASVTRAGGMAPTPPPAMQPMAAPSRMAAPVRHEPVDVRDEKDDDKAIRSLIVRQKADGLFDGDLLVTLAAVAALAAHGHTARAGLFRAELARTLKTLRALAASRTGDDRAWIDAAILLLASTDAPGEARAKAAIAPFRPAFAASKPAEAIAKRFALA
jgi:hypothetical protein